MSADRRREKPPPARPLAPRLAATATTTISSRSSPAPRLAPQLVSPNAPAVRRPATIPSFDATQDDTSVANITPRSAARKLRPDTTSGSSTPVSVRSDVNGQQRPKSTLTPGTRTQRAGSATPTISERSDSDLNRLIPTALGSVKRPFSPTGSYASTPGTRPSNVAGEQNAQGSSFFYANDRPADAPTQRPTPTTRATFMYANGSSEESDRPFINSNTATPKAALTQFSTTTAAQHNPESLPVSATISPSVQPTASPFFRSPSPTKDSFHLTYRKGVSQILRPPLSGAGSPSVDSHTRRTSQELSRGPRRSSIDGKSEGTSHSRGASQSSVGSNNQPVPLRLDSATVHNSEMFKWPVTSPVLASVPTAFSEPNLLSAPGSPVRANFPAQRPHSSAYTDTASSTGDLAAEARRERKVLDLEITNNSLLAINRSLEREVRKQKSELRRMRRMTRNSNRQSWLSSNSDTTQLSALDEEASDMSDESSDDEDGDDSNTGSFDDDALSPEALALNDAKHQRGDERRLKLDLTKHKELLVDSQKLNQSIKRCLGVTEQLIIDGKKALEYQVRVSEVQLGGRVLSPEELADRDALDGSPGDGNYFRGWDGASTRNISGASSNLQAIMEMTDRDSGVDLEDVDPPSRLADALHTLSTSAPEAAVKTV
ncbi:hypothetical protein FH972_021051 [Carpinus fangiana]|uniref:Uncharacterized protein n=1 Tax=Carpinus fangiana TaxID=176857 RepID=A0A5N6KN81_9ROSI|nr:hypothetical protein FH972_021051 [Carpinus fangiana]